MVEAIDELRNTFMMSLATEIDEPPPRFGLRRENKNFQGRQERRKHFDGEPHRHKSRRGKIHVRRVCPTGLAQLGVLCTFLILMAQQNMVKHGRSLVDEY